MALGVFCMPSHDGLKAGEKELEKFMAEGALPDGKWSETLVAMGLVK